MATELHRQDVQKGSGTTVRCRLLQVGEEIRVDIRVHSQGEDLRAPDGGGRMNGHWVRGGEIPGGERYGHRATNEISVRLSPVEIKKRAVTAHEHSLSTLMEGVKRCEMTH